MTDSKISALVAATSLVGTDEFVIATGGASKKVTLTTLLTALPGHELVYAQVTANTSITANSEATANTIVTAASITLDGATVIDLEFFSIQVQSPGGATSRFTSVVFYDNANGAGAASIGTAGLVFTDANARVDTPMHCVVRITPASGTHVFSARAYANAGTGNVHAGAGGSGNEEPAFIRAKVVA